MRKSADGRVYFLAQASGIPFGGEQNIVFAKMGQDNKAYTKGTVESELVDVLIDRLGCEAAKAMVEDRCPGEDQPGEGETLNEMVERKAAEAAAEGSEDAEAKAAAAADKPAAASPEEKGTPSEDKPKAVSRKKAPAKKKAKKTTKKK
jgi:hypothetical protein